MVNRDLKRPGALRRLERPGEWHGGVGVEAVQDGTAHQCHAVTLNQFQTNVKAGVERFPAVDHQQGHVHVFTGCHVCFDDDVLEREVRADVVQGNNQPRFGFRISGAADKGPPGIVLPVCPAPDGGLRRERGRVAQPGHVELETEHGVAIKHGRSVPGLRLGWPHRIQGTHLTCHGQVAAPSLGFSQIDTNVDLIEVVAGNRRCSVGGQQFGREAVQSEGGNLHRGQGREFVRVPKTEFNFVHQS